MGWISRATLHPELCANSLVADDTLKRSMATSTRNGYGASEMDVLPRSLEHVPIRGYTTPKDDVKSSLIVKLENSLMRPCMSRAICISRTRMVRGGLGTRPGVGLSTAKIHDTGGPAANILGRDGWRERRSGGAARAED